MLATLTQRIRITRAIAGFCLAFVLVPLSSVSASGLQVSPTSLSLASAQQADGLWLRNSGDATLHAQVRVYHWTQEDGKDRLDPSRGLVASPPILALDPQQSQLVRVIRTGGAPRDAEDAYRLVVNELPVKDDKEGGLKFVLRYSIPVFIQAAGQGDAAPELTWALSRDNGHAVIDVSNRGKLHAQISDVTYINASGKRHTLKQGLLGYALPGRHMHWELPVAGALISPHGKLEAKVNGETVTPTVSLDTDAH